jgi:hypothetical protein
MSTGTQPATPAKKPTFLSKLGTDLKIGIKDVFGWLGSSQGKTAIAGAETAAVAIATPLGEGPMVSGILGLVNGGLNSATAIESLAAQAGTQTGTGTQKAAAVATVLGGSAAQFLESVGVKDATAEEVQNLSSVIASASADILNAIPARAQLSTTAPAAPPSGSTQTIQQQAA